MKEKMCRPKKCISTQNKKHGQLEFAADPVVLLKGRRSAQKRKKKKTQRKKTNGRVSPPRKRKQMIAVGLL